MTVGADQRSCQSWPPVTSGGQCPYSTAHSTSVQALYSADRGDHWPELTSCATRHSLLTLCSSLAPEFPVPWQWRPVTAHSGQWPRHGPGEPGTTPGSGPAIIIIIRNHRISDQLYGHRWSHKNIWHKYNFQLGTSFMVNNYSLIYLIFQKFLGMCHDELLQTKNVPISRWLLHLQGKVKQVTIIRIV